MSTPSHYEVLGIAWHASSAEIKRAYHMLALKWHPDKNIKHKDASAKAVAEEKFKQISAAYRVLSNPRERREYDRERGVGGVPLTARF